MAFDSQQISSYLIQICTSMIGVCISMKVAKQNESGETLGELGRKQGDVCMEIKETFMNERLLNYVW